MPASTHDEYDVRGTVTTGSGHWLIDEAPQQVIPALVEFIN